MSSSLNIHADHHGWEREEIEPATIEVEAHRREKENGKKYAVLKLKVEGRGERHEVTLFVDNVEQIASVARQIDQALFDFHLEDHGHPGFDEEVDEAREAQYDLEAGGV